MSNWASKFRSREDLEMDKLRGFIQEQDKVIKEASAAVMAGAPGMDFHQVRALKALLDKNRREREKHLRAIIKLKEKAEQKGNK